MKLYLCLTREFFIVGMLPARLYFGSSGSLEIPQPFVLGALQSSGEVLFLTPCHLWGGTHGGSCSPSSFRSCVPYVLQTGTLPPLKEDVFQTLSHIFSIIPRHVNPWGRSSLGKPGSQNLISGSQWYIEKAKAICRKHIKVTITSLLHQYKYWAYDMYQILSLVLRQRCHSPCCQVCM